MFCVRRPKEFSVLPPKGRAGCPLRNTGAGSMRCLRKKHFGVFWPQHAREAAQKKVGLRASAPGGPLNEGLNEFSSNAMRNCAEGPFFFPLSHTLLSLTLLSQRPYPQHALSPVSPEIHTFTHHARWRFEGPVTYSIVVAQLLC